MIFKIELIYLKSWWNFDLPFFKEWTQIVNIIVSLNG